jgi:hypothetical protein
VLVVAAVVLFATAAIAQARPVVNLGMAKENGCNPGGQLNGCAVRKVYFQNTTNKQVIFDTVEISGRYFDFGPDPFDGSSTCITNFAIDPHSSCDVLAVASPTKVGWNGGFINLWLHDRILYHADLVVHGVSGNPGSSAATHTAVVKITR